VEASIHGTSFHGLSIAAIHCNSFSKYVFIIRSNKVLVHPNM
jgi:hypothetical protein